ncbi:MAG: DVUA0089 family protein, partial [Undibacterium sp.]|nr:DVUA0089 family protein [Opitutaceae bacterium]
LIRGIGPTLTGFGVTGALADPILALTTANGVLIASSDDWGNGSNPGEIAATSARVGAFALPSASKDAAILVTLAPGNYTALLGGTNNTSGVALLEVYEVP